MTTAAEDTRSASSESFTPGTRLTIGMPLYNNAATIRRALDSMIGQSYRGFRLLISDDGSKDGTAAICDEYAARDSRLEVVRQPKNLNYGNFRYVLARATTELFMFAAGDDYWHPDYVMRMIDALDRDPDAVCAVSRIAFVKNGDFVLHAKGTKPLLGTPMENIIRYLASKDDNSRMYGVFRTPVARRAFPPGDFFAYDWAFSAGTLREGRHVEVPEVLMWRDYTDIVRYTEYVRRDTEGVLRRFFPMLPMTYDLLTRLRIPASLAIVKQLVRLNAYFHLEYLHRYYPRAYAINRRVHGVVARIARRMRLIETNKP